MEGFTFAISSSATSSNVPAPSDQSVNVVAQDTPFSTTTNNNTLSNHPSDAMRTATATTVLTPASASVTAASSLAHLVSPDGMEWSPTITTEVPNANINASVNETLAAGLQANLYSVPAIDQVLPPWSQDPGYGNRLVPIGSYLRRTSGYEKKSRPSIFQSNTLPGRVHAASRSGRAFPGQTAAPRSLVNPIIDRRPLSEVLRKSPRLNEGVLKQTSRESSSILLSSRPSERKRFSFAGGVDKKGRSQSYRLSLPSKHKPRHHVQNLFPNITLSAAIKNNVSVSDLPSPPPRKSLQSVPNTRVRPFSPPNHQPLSQNLQTPQPFAGRRRSFEEFAEDTSVQVGRYELESSPIGPLPGAFPIEAQMDATGNNQPNGEQLDAQQYWNPVVAAVQNIRRAGERIDPYIPRRDDIVAKVNSTVARLGTAKRVLVQTIESTRRCVIESVIGLRHRVTATTYSIFISLRPRTADVRTNSPQRRRQSRLRGIGNPISYLFGRSVQNRSDDALDAQRLMEEIKSPKSILRSSIGHQRSRLPRPSVIWNDSPNSGNPVSSTHVYEVPDSSLLSESSDTSLFMGGHSLETLVTEISQDDSDNTPPHSIDPRTLDSQNVDARADDDDSDSSPLSSPENVSPPMDATSPEEVDSPSSSSEGSTFMPDPTSPCPVVQSKTSASSDKKNDSWAETHIQHPIAYTSSTEPTSHSPDNLESDNLASDDIARLEQPEVEEPEGQRLRIETVADLSTSDATTDVESPSEYEKPITDEAGLVVEPEDSSVEAHQEPPEVESSEIQPAASKVSLDFVTPNKVAGSKFHSPELKYSARRTSRRIQQSQDQEWDQLSQLQIQVDVEKLLREEEEQREREEAERREAERLIEIERERRSHRREPAGPVITPIPSEWEIKLAAAMATPFNRNLAQTSTGTSIDRRAMGTLLPQAGSGDASSGWLNDEIILAGMQQTVDFALEVTGHRRNTTPSVHSFNSFFYKNLEDKGPEYLQRWSRRAKIGGDNLLNVALVFVPINLGYHWTLAVVMPTKRRVEYFDSMHGSGRKALENLEQWIRCELGDRYVADEWTYQEGISPHQENGRDCGVFVISTARMIMLGLDPEKAYDQNDMPLQRKRIACELLAGGLTGPFAPTDLGEPGVVALGRSGRGLVPA